MQNNFAASYIQKIALGCGFFTVFFLGQAIPILAIPHYQMSLGVNPGLLGVFMAVPLFLASCFGVWFGHMSDKLQTRFGRRPFLLLAAIVAAMSYGLLWMPPAGWSDKNLLLYFGSLSVLFQFASVIYSISLNSLVYENSPNSLERTRLLGFTAYFVKVGSFCYQWLYPLSTLVLFGGLVLGVVGVGWLLAIVVFFLMGILPVIVVKEPLLAARDELSAQSKKLSERSNFYQGVVSTLNNKAMVFILGLTLLQMGGAAYVATMDYYLLVYFVYAGDIASGAVAKGVLSTAYAIVSIVSVPLIVYLARRFGRLQALSVIYLINALGGLLKWFVFVPDAGLWVVIDAVLCGTIWTAMVILIPSMIADLAHNEGLSMRNNRSGTYASIYAWCLSLSGVAVLIISGCTLSLIGFDAALGGQQDTSALLLMRVILSLGTIIFSLLAFILVKRWQADRSQYQFVY